MISSPSGEEYDLESVMLESQEANSRRHVPTVMIWRVIFSANVKSVARRSLGVQSGANERRYPPLPPLTCSADWAYSQVKCRNKETTAKPAPQTIEIIDAKILRRLCLAESGGITL